MFWTSIARNRTRRRGELLSEEVLENLGHARRVLARWRCDYNNARPHSSLGGQTPARRSAELLVGPATTSLANIKPINYETKELSF